jgi:hypothetical protein
VVIKIENVQSAATHIEEILMKAQGSSSYGLAQCSQLVSTSVKGNDRSFLMVMRIKKLIHVKLL